MITALKFGLCILTIYIIFIILIYFFQRNLIYYPDHKSYTPEEASVPEMEEVYLNTSDHLKIKGWYRKPQNSHLPTIVYFHGNAGNISDRGFIAKHYYQNGLGVLLVTYRGYSGNPGSPTEQGLYNDAEAAMQLLHDKGTSNDCIVLIGNSIGAAVALQIATKHNVAALILQSPFSSLYDVAKIHYAFFMPFRSLIKDKYDSLSKAKKVKVPVMIIHGQSDNIIPPELSRKLLEALPATAEAKYIPNRGHNDLFEPGIIIDFIEKTTNCGLHPLHSN